MLSKIENARSACGPTTRSRLACGLGVPVPVLFPERPVEPAIRFLTVTAFGNSPRH